MADPKSMGPPEAWRPLPHAAAPADEERPAAGEALPLWPPGGAAASARTSHAYGATGAGGVPGKPGARLADTTSSEAEDDRLCPKAKEHQPWLDVTRICCVALVAIDHGDWRYGDVNTAFAQNWVLQYLFLVCGVCYGMSRRSLGGYLLRLGGYAVLGICINWSAWLAKRMDWRDDFFSVVFHFWFVIGLMIYAVLLAPLRTHLARVHAVAATRRLLAAPAGAAPPPTPEAEQQVAASRADDGSSSEGAASSPTDEAKTEERMQKDQLTRALVVIGGGVVGLMICFTILVRPLLKLLAPSFLSLVIEFGPKVRFWGLPQTQAESFAFLQRLCTYLNLTCTNFWLLIACPKVFERTGLAAWAILLNTYGHRLLFYRANDERPFHGLDLMTIALTCYYLGMLHRRMIGKYVIRYWFVVAWACCGLWPIDLHGRMDEQPPRAISTRIRVNLIEAIFVVVWLTAGERLVQPEIFTEDRLDFMNDWALVVFLVHKAVHILISPPMNWMFLILLIPICYLRRHMP